MSGGRLWVVRCTYVMYGVMLNVILEYKKKKKKNLMCQMLGVFLFKNKRGCSNLFEYLTIPSGICSPLSTLTKLLQEGIP